MLFQKISVNKLSNNANNYLGEKEATTRSLVSSMFRYIPSFRSKLHFWSAH